MQKLACCPPTVPNTQPAHGRALLEPRATDSFQNLLFSLLRFVRATGRAPAHVTLVSHGFKRRRFLEQHCAALRVPAERVTFVGADPPEDYPGEDGEGRRRREWEVGSEKVERVWDEDWYGWGEQLRAKRVQRGWVEVGGLEGWEGWEREIVAWEGGGSRREPFKRSLPWDEGALALES